MSRLLALWINLRSSLWFVPALIVLSAIALGSLLAQVGDYFPALSQASLPSLFGFSAQGSRAMLSAIASSMITVAGVAFSITIVALSLASTQYSPRVLRQFMADRSNQVVLGTFVGIFAYCLVVLPTVRGGEEAGHVPALAVAFGVLLALIGVGCLVFFIHHVAAGIQASSIIANITAETHPAIDVLFPDTVGEEFTPAPGELERLRWRPIAAPASGFLQLVHEGALLEAAARHDLVVRMEYCIGDFVLAGTPLVSVSRSGGRADAAEGRELAAAFTINRTRTIDQDSAFGVRQIVDAALRALSPALNDTTTAVMCIDYLTDLLRHAAARQCESRFRCREGRLRVIALRTTFADLLHLAFDQILEQAADNRVVVERLLRALELIAAVTQEPGRRETIAGGVVAIGAAVERAVEDPATRTRLVAHARQLAARMRAVG